jgi:hypothetical protein
VKEKKLARPHWVSGYPIRHSALNHKIMDESLFSGFGELRSAVSVERE